MKKITVKDVRTVLVNMGNTSIGQLTDEELSSAILQDDLGMEDNEIFELVAQLEKIGGFYFIDVANDFLQRTRSISVNLLRYICNHYVCETKPCYS